MKKEEFNSGVKDMMILKMIKPLISEEKISELINFFTQDAIKFHELEMESRNPDHDIIAMAWLKGDTAMLSLAVIDIDFKIIEVIRTEQLTETANRLIKNL